MPRVVTALVVAGVRAVTVHLVIPSTAVCGQIGHHHSGDVGNLFGCHHAIDFTVTNLFKIGLKHFTSFRFSGAYPGFRDTNVGGRAQEVGGVVALFFTIELIDAVGVAGLLAVTLAVTDVIRCVTRTEQVILVTSELALFLCKHKQQSSQPQLTSQ